jgi:hypothetical protein
MLLLGSSRPNITPPSMPSSTELDSRREDRCASAEEAAAHKATALKNRIPFIILIVGLDVMVDDNKAAENVRLLTIVIPRDHKPGWVGTA